jgi:hypothetical protein
MLIDFLQRCQANRWRGIGDSVARASQQALFEKSLPSELSAALGAKSSRGPKDRIP